jgi:hypothetical protein
LTAIKCRKIAIDRRRSIKSPRRYEETAPRLLHWAGIAATAAASTVEWMSRETVSTPRKDGGPRRRNAKLKDEFDRILGDIALVHERRIDVHLAWVMKSARRYAGASMANT